MWLTNDFSNLKADLQVINVIEIRHKNTLGHTGILGKLKKQLEIDLVNALKDVNGSSSEVASLESIQLGFEAGNQPRVLGAFSSDNV